MNRRDFLIKLIQSIGLVTGSSGLLLSPMNAWSKTAFDYALEGQNFIQQKNFSKAINALQKAIEIEPENDFVMGLLGLAYNGAGQKAKAVAAFRKAVRINPHDTYSRMMIDRITQNPIPKTEKTKRPLTPLEIQARQEDNAMLSQLEKTSGLSYQVKRVVIDAGHGGFDPGAVGKTGLKEKDVTLDLALRLHEKIARMGRVKPYLTRTGDYYVPLSARTVIANQFQADLFISLHINANKKRQPRGSETYYCSEKASSSEAQKVAAYENSVIEKFSEPFRDEPGFIDIEEILFKFEQKLNWDESGRFAQHFQARFKKGLPFRSRGVHSANFYVLRRTKMPSILLETGFISNPDDEAMLKKNTVKEKIVDAVIQAL